MTKGELSHKFGELLIVLSHIDSSAYDSPESLEAPYSDKEMADKIKPLGKKDDIKQIDKRNIQKSIDFLTRVSSGYLEQNAIKNEYKIVDRKGWATTENGPAFDEDQLAVDKAIDKKYAVAKRIIEDADIYMMLEDLDFTSMVEFYVTLNRQQQRCRNLFIKEYEKRRKNDIFFRENHTKDEIKRHNKSIAYEILTGTALGKMTMATNYLVSNTNCSLMSNGYPFLATTLSTRLDRMVRIRKKVGINQFVENGNKKISKINGESITSVADFVRDGESYIAAKEHQHVERLFEDAIRGKGLKAAQIKSYKTIPAQPV